MAKKKALPTYRAIFTLGVSLSATDERAAMKEAVAVKERFEKAGFSIEYRLEVKS